MVKNFRLTAYSFRLTVSLLILGLLAALGCQDLLFPYLPVVGIIQGSGELESYNQTYRGIVDGLREAGFHDGFSIRLKAVTVDNQRERAFQAAQDLAEAGARLLVCLGTIPTLAALEATNGKKIPIVYSIVGAPEATGLSRPEIAGEVRFTGASMEIPAREQLQMLRQAIPEITRLGVLFCPATPQGKATAQEMAEAAGVLGFQVFSQAVSLPDLADLPAFVASLLDKKIEGMVIPTDPILGLPKNLKRIIQEADRAGVPVQVATGSQVPLGALLAYHCDFYDIGRQSGRQAGRILAGAPVGEVPPEKPHLRRLTVNLKVAQALGLDLSRSFLSLANTLVQ